MSSLIDLFNSRNDSHFDVHDKLLNHQLRSVLKTLGFDKTYVKAQGPYLYTKEGERYLDLLSGYGVHAFGRNHPQIIAALKDVLDAELPNMVQFDCPIPAACLAEKLAPLMPEGIDKFFFCNSGTEAVEGAIKFARAATKRDKILYCSHAFHGLSTGSLALNGSEVFKEPFGPLLPGTDKIPFDDLDALENALKTKEYAAFVIEPIQGKGVYIASENYFEKASELCQRYKTLLVLDEIQTGIGRTGKFLALEHWRGAKPDIITMAKALSGGFVPIGVIAMRKSIFNKTYKNMEHAVVHSCTFGRNNLAMSAAIATLDVLEQENITQLALDNGEKLRAGLEDALLDFEMVKEVRGKGMMIGIEFQAPQSLALKASWKMLEAANKGLFLQMIVIPLFTEHKMLTQVAGPGSYVIKLIPPLNISEQDIQDIIAAFKQVVTNAHKLGGAWKLGATLAKHAMAGGK